MIDEIELRNCGPFRGEQFLNLRADVYGVVASTGGDERRSNWAGKTFLFEAIGFVLDGSHRFRTDDEWISEGEDEGGAALRVGQWRIERSRKRGGPTQLLVEGPGGMKLKGEPAQDLIREQIVGLSKSDYEELCWARQKNHAGLVRMRPEERMARFRSWCALEALQIASKMALALAEALKIEAQGKRAALARADADLAECWKEIGAEVLDDAAIDARLGAFDSKIADLRRRTESIGEERSRIRIAKDRAALKERAEKARAQAKAHAAVEAKAPSAAEAKKSKEEADGARTSLQAARLEGARLAQLVVGNFDGTCPVNKRECPIAEKIRNDKAAARLASNKAASIEAAALERDKEARRVADAIAAASRAAAQAAGARLSIEEQLASFGELPAVEPAIASDESLLAESRSIEGEIAELLRQHDRLGQARVRARKLLLERSALSAGDAASGRAEGLHRLAYEVLGRAGAQKIMAEEARADIEEAANAALARAGVELEVKLEWGRETRVLEPQCQRCGEIAAAKSKQRACIKCGAARDYQRTDGLEIVLSRVSGAAEDLAGLALLLAASSWVRAQRGSTWSTILVDEPFAALDEHHREALAAHIVALLRGDHAFAQSLVVAHHREVTDAMPGRIALDRRPEGTAVRVLRAEP